MVLIEFAQEIVSDYKYELIHNHGFFGIGSGKKIEISDEVTEEQFSNIFVKIFERLGSPVFVHSYYGFIWEKDNAYLTLNFIEKSYNCDVLTIFTLRKIPVGKKVKYDVYKQIDDIIKKEFTQQNLNLDSFIHYHGKQFSCFGVNDTTQCLLVLKRHSLSFYYSSKEPFGEGMTRVIPRYTRNERISLQDLSSVEQALHNCFVTK